MKSNSRKEKLYELSNQSITLDSLRMNFTYRPEQATVTVQSEIAQEILDNCIK